MTHLKCAFSLCCLLLFVSVFGHLHAQTTASHEWIRTYQPQINDWDDGKAVTQDDAGNVYLLGNVNLGLNGGEVLLQKFDPNGTLLWEKGYTNAFNQGDRAIDVKVDSTGNAHILVDTYFSSFSMADFMVRKFDPNGNVLWTTYFDGAQRQDYGTVLHVSSAGMVTAAGLSTIGNFEFDHEVIRIDPNGNILWNTLLIAPAVTWWNAMDIEVTPTGETYMIASPSMDAFGGMTGDCRFAKISNTGVVEWDTLLPRSAGGIAFYGAEVDLDANQEPILYLYHEGDSLDLYIKGFDTNGQLRGEAILPIGPFVGGRPHGMVVGPNEFIYVTYYDEDNLSPSNRMVKIAPDFHVVWDRVIELDYTNPPGVYNSLEFGPNGNLVMGGMKDYSNSQSDIADDLMVIEYDTAGTLVQRLDWDGTGQAKDVFSEMAIDPSGGVVIAAQSMEAIPNRDMAVVRIDLGGGNDWARYYNSFKPGGVFMMGTGVDGSGNSYLVGNVNDGDIVAGIQLVKYDPSGTLVWDKVYRTNPLSATFADKMLVDTAGNIFIAGHGVFGASNDFYVIKLDGNGDEVWTYIEGPNSGQNYHGRDIRLDAQGNVFAGANQTMPDFTSRWYLCSLSPAGTLNYKRWVTSPSVAGSLSLDAFIPTSNGAWAGGENEGQPIAFKLTVNGQLTGQTVPSLVAEHEEIRFGLSVQGFPTFLSSVNDTAGGTPISNKWDWNLVRFDDNGSLLWETRFPGASLDEAKPTVLAIDAADKIFAGGSSGFISNTVARFDTSGGLEWEYTGPIGGPAFKVEVADLKPMPGGGGVYTGRLGGISFNSVVERIDPQGNLLWTYSYSNSLLYENTWGHSLAVAPTGELFAGLVGQVNLNRYAMVLVKFSKITDLPDPTPSDISLVYPQPAHGHLNVQWEGLRTSSQVKVDLLDVQGRLVHRSTVHKTAPQSTQISIDLPTVSAGIYILQLENQQGQLIRDKVLID